MSILTTITARVAGLALPSWAPWAAVALAIVALGAGSYGMGRVHEARIGAAALAEYKENAAIQTVRIVERQGEVKTVVHVKYVDRLKKIYVQGERIKTLVPQYITREDAARFAVNTGFVRVLDAGWTGDPPGPAVDSDRKPSGIPIDGIASVEASNATSCRAWREHVYGWRDFCARQQVAVNGKAGEWSRMAPAGEK